MYKGLYDKFKDWFHNDRGNIWFYSDPHFGDEEMIYLRANYIGDLEQVKRINSKVGKYDTIIFLGDIGNPEYISDIRGYKVLIKGNHDSGNANYEKYFDEIYEGALCVSEKIILSHEPIYFPFVLNVHGHDHSNWEFQDEMHWNVCAEHINYTPISLNDIIKSGRLKKINSIHRVTIDKATERSKTSLVLEGNP